MCAVVSPMSKYGVPFVLETQVAQYMSLTFSSVESVNLSKHKFYCIRNVSYERKVCAYTGTRICRCDLEVSLAPGFHYILVLENQLAEGTKSQACSNVLQSTCNWSLLYMEERELVQYQYVILPT